MRELVDSGDVYEPGSRLTPDEAYRFLHDIPLLEESGVVVRVPDWWTARRPPRPQVQVTVGTRAPGGVGTDALLDFDVRRHAGRPGADRARRSSASPRPRAGWR